MMPEIVERVEFLEKDMIGVKACVEANLVGERSVWAAIEKLTESISGFEQSSVTDRKEIREMVHGQALDAAKMATAYAGMAGVLKAVGLSVIASLIGIVVGLLTHTIVIGG
jgi:hypothetical protein